MSMEWETFGALKAEVVSLGEQRHAAVVMAERWMEKLQESELRLAGAMIALRDIAGMNRGCAEEGAADTAAKALTALGEPWEYDHDARRHRPKERP